MPFQDTAFSLQTWRPSLMTSPSEGQENHGSPRTSSQYRCQDCLPYDQVGMDQPYQNLNFGLRNPDVMAFQGVYLRHEEGLTS